MGVGRGEICDHDTLLHLFIFILYVSYLKNHLCLLQSFSWSMLLCKSEETVLCCLQYDMLLNFINVLLYQLRLLGDSPKQSILMPEYCTLLSNVI